jgi:membrane protein DedA with SNARE-associated domain
MTDALQLFAQWLARHTYAVVIAGATIDATGFPFPGRLLLVAAGAIAAGGHVDTALVIVLGAAGTMLGDHFWYFAGALGSDRLLGLYCRFTFSSRRCRRRTNDWFRRFGALTIVVGRFVAGVRLLAWPLARDHGVGYGTFLAFDMAGALLWSMLWVGLGWLVGDHWREAAHQTTWLVPAALIAGLLAMIATRLWRRARYGPATI